MKKVAFWVFWVGVSLCVSAVVVLATTDDTPTGTGLLVSGIIVAAISLTLSFERAR